MQGMSTHYCQCFIRFIHLHSGLTKLFAGRRYLIFLGFAAAMIAIIVIIVAVAVTTSSSAPLKPSSTKQRVLQVLQRVPLIDGHNDLPWQLRNNYKDQLEKVSLISSLWNSTRDFGYQDIGKRGTTFGTVFQFGDVFCFTDLLSGFYI